MTELLVVIICLCVNAIFSSIEMAFVTIGKPELRKKAQKGDEKALRLLALRENPERALSVIQIGITLVGAVSAAVGGAGAEESLSPIFESRFGFSENVSEGLAIAAVVVPLTYFSVVLGELVPKTIALRFPSQVLAFGTSVLYIGSRILGPIVTIFEVSTLWIVKMVLPKAAVPNVEQPSSELNLDGLSTHQRQYIMNLANIEMKKVKDAYLPWDEVDWIDYSAKFEDVAASIIENGHTRMPVVDKGILKGVLHSKVFLAFASTGSQDWHSVLRTPVTVKPQDELLTVLRVLQGQKRHMAVVVDNQNLMGVITLEDIIEEIVGDIFDDYDDGLIEKILANRAAIKPRG